MSRKSKIIEELKQIRNIGPQMAEKLFNAGIHDLESMKKEGAEEIYIKIDESGGFCCKHNACYLYAIEGAITNCSWQNIPKARKEELKNFTKRLRDQSSS